MAEKNEQATDIQMAGSLVIAGLLSEEGLQTIQQLLQQQEADPATAIGNLVFSSLNTVRQKLDQRGIGIDDRLWAPKGGVLDRVIFDVINVLTDILGVKEAATGEFAASLKHVIVEQMAQADQGGAGQPGAMPEQGMPPQGMGPPQGAPQGPSSPLLGGM